ncbi:MAG: nicotinamide mononucleotide transporter [Clostridiales bacterium]|nr:nicotinamide mononucleotide transporter [Clostridiales bacterium]
MKKSKLSLKFFTPAEWALTVISFTLIITSFFIAPLVKADRNVFSMIASLIGVMGIIFMSRGSHVAHYIYVVFSILYVVVSCYSRYFGEAIIYGCLMLPIHVWSIISWKKNLTKDNSVLIETNKPYETAVIVGGSILFTVPFFFILKALNTDNLLFSTLSFGTSLTAAVLMLRRNKYFSFVFLIDDVLSIFLWGSKLLFGVYSFIPTLITVLAAAINDGYSFYKWCKRSKLQTKEKTQDEQ